MQDQGNMSRKYEVKREVQKCKRRVYWCKVSENVGVESWSENMGARAYEKPLEKTKI